MCRWLAYSGPSLRMDALLLEPEHSFIRQSFSAWGSSYAVNGDGVGVGWYGEDASPGLYRDTRPAWNDENLLGLSGHVRSHLFLAHVRATSGSAVQRTNCHPFLHDRWRASSPFATPPRGPRHRSTTARSPRPCARATPARRSCPMGA